MAARSAPQSLDRTGLERLVDQYCAAVVAHDPGRLPLASDVRFTEMGQEIELGDGFWATASGIGNYKTYYADVDAGEIGFFGTMEENGNAVLMGLRLKVELGLITEIETAFYRRGGGPAWNDAGIDNFNKKGKPFDIWRREIPPAERMSRQDLITTANYYFAGLEHNDGKGYYPFTDDCHRLENGVATSNNPDLKMGDDKFNPAAMKVKDSMASGFYGVVTRIQDRRFPVVDRERGIVLSFATFCHGGNVPTVKLSDGREFNMRFFSRPSSILIFEAFKIEKGLIAQVEALGTSVPYALKTGWPGGISGH
jgi:hypothetical protein